MATTDEPGWMGIGWTGRHRSMWLARASDFVLCELPQVSEADRFGLFVGSGCVVSEEVGGAGYGQEVGAGRVCDSARLDIGGRRVVPAGILAG